MDRTLISVYIEDVGRLQFSDQRTLGLHFASVILFFFNLFSKKYKQTEHKSGAISSAALKV